MDIVFVRHGATDWSGRRYCGRSDPPLSVDGRVAAHELAARLAPRLARDVLIVTSPARRARETAEAISAAASVDGIEVDERWSEADFGIAEGRTFDELARFEPDLASALADGATDIDWPGGETAGDFAARVEAAWMTLVVRARPAVVVSHAGPIRHAVALARELEPADVGLPEPATEVLVEVAPDRAQR
jgi:ribonuclease H / adenosylcobalamin/alpha-ribazole phosphatase